MNCHPAATAGPSADPADNSWLLRHLPSLPCFAEFYPHISSSLRSACQVENDPNAVGWYIQFLCHYAPTADLKDLGSLQQSHPPLMSIHFFDDSAILQM